MEEYTDGVDGGVHWHLKRSTLTWVHWRKWILLRVMSCVCFGGVHTDVSEFLYQHSTTGSLRTNRLHCLRTKPYRRVCIWVNIQPIEYVRCIMWDVCLCDVCLWDAWDEVSEMYQWWFLRWCMYHARCISDDVSDIISCEIYQWDAWDEMSHTNTDKRK